MEDLDHRARRLRQIDRLLDVIRESDDRTTVSLGSQPGAAEALRERCPDAETSIAVYGYGPDDGDAYVLAWVETTVGLTTITATFPKRAATPEERRQLVGERGNLHESYRSARIGGDAC